MSEQQTDKLEELVISDKEVAEYLGRNLDFFASHNELLASLKLKHHTGSVISLIERQVDVLRGKNHELEQKLNNLISIARENDTLNKRMQKMTLSLIEASNLNEIMTCIQESLRNDFEADSVVIRLFRQPDEDIESVKVIIVDRNDSRLDIFKRFFESRKPICGQMSKAQSDYLFGEESSRIASAVLLPICGNECYGMLAIGSTDCKRFYSGMGTLFLTYMGEMIGLILKSHLSSTCDGNGDDDGDGE